VLVRADTDPHGRTVFTIQAERATLRTALESIAVEARLELVVDEDVAHRVLSSLVTVALEDATLRQALDLLLGRFDLEYSVADGEVIVVPPAKRAFRSAEERLRQKAQLAYQAALVRYPDHGDAARAHLLLGQRFHARALHPQAIEQLERLAREYPRSSHLPAALLTMGHSCAALGDHERAGAAWRSIVATYPRDPLAAAALLALATRSIAVGKPAEALPLLEEIVKQHPDAKARPEAEVRLAETLLAVQHYDRALAHFARLLEQGVGPQAERRLRLLQGRALMAQGKGSEAREALYRLRRAFASTPEGAEAYYLLADTYFREKDYLRAIEAYRGALAEAPDEPCAQEAATRLAELYRQMTLYDLAIATYDAILAEHPHTPRRRAILHALGECYSQRGSHQKAQLHFERAAQGDDEQAWRSAFRAGQAALADGRPTAALPFFRRVAQAAADRSLVADCHAALGQCYRRLGRLDDALAAYEQAAAHQPGPRPPKGEPSP